MRSHVGSHVSPSVETLVRLPNQGGGDEEGEEEQDKEEELRCQMKKELTCQFDVLAPFTEGGAEGSSATPFGGCPSGPGLPVTQQQQQQQSAAPSRGLAAGGSDRLAEGAEAARVRGLRDPGQPTKAEREQHELFHVPFRPWCKHCVEGRAVDDPHRRQEEDSEGETRLPKVSVDYGFMKLDGEETPRILLVLKAKPSRVVAARCVTAKGREDPTAAAWLVANLQRLGLGRCVLQADGEPATRALVKEVIEQACSIGNLGVSGVHAPAYDHRANGAAERAVQEVKAQVRVMHRALVAKVGPVPSSSAVFDWLVSWAAEALTCAQIGPDGMTAYRRLRGSNWNVQVAEFGEQVMGRRPRAIEQGSLEARWDPGTYLGTRWGTMEHFVAVQDGTVRQIRTIRRVSEDRRWSREAILGVTGVPANLNKTREPEAVAPPEVVHPEPAEPPPKVTKSFHIRAEDFAQYGYTVGCPRCDTIRTGMGNAGSHSRVCRERFRELLRQREDPRLERERLRRGGLPQGAVALPAGDVPDVQLAGEEVRSAAGDEPAASEPRASARPAEQAMADDLGTSRGDPVQDDSRGRADVPMDEEGPATDEAMLDQILELPPRVDKTEEMRRLGMVMGLTPRQVKTVVELFSPPRVNKELRRRSWGIEPGICFDLGVDQATGERWDFTKAGDRRRCWQKLRDNPPWIIIGSPPCTPFCQLNANINYAHQILGSA